MTFDGLVTMRGTHYNPADLLKTLSWAVEKIATGNWSAWEGRYLNSEIERIRASLRQL